MQPSTRPECDFKYKERRAICTVCGRSFSAPNGHTRAYCSAETETIQKAELPHIKAQSGQWTGQWELVQGCPNTSDCSCYEPTQGNPEENQTYQTPCLSPSNFICDYSQGCIENPYGSWGTTLAECQLSCDRHFECSQAGCVQNTYFSDFQTWQFRDQPSCETECIDRYTCDQYQGCQPNGKSTTGLTLSECDNCVVTQVDCDYFSGCRDIYGIGDPNAIPPICPSDCKRHFECGFSGCTQSLYFTQYGYEEEQCEAVCLETFYCDNSAGCQGIWSDSFYYPYSDLTSCETACVDRVYCAFTNGCLPAGKGGSGPTDCSEISETCGERFYCDEYEGCTSQGYGELNPGQSYSCDSSSCIQYFICSYQGCSERHYNLGETTPEGGFATRDECNNPSNCFLSGCTNPHSPNYNYGATCDDGSCITCCNSGRCIVDDQDASGNCNRIDNGCCDNFCLNAGDCSPTYTTSFDAQACDGTTIVYHDCYGCPSS